MHISGADPPFASALLASYHASPSGDAFIVMDAAGIVRAWSRACEVLLGWSAEEAAGQSISVIFTPEDRDRKIDLYELEVARTKGHAEDDRWHVRRDDSRVWVTGTMTAVRAEDGSLLGFVKVMRDRTDLRTKIEHLEQERDTLQERLQRAQLFLHTLGHELRNPLAPLSMAVHLMGTRETAPASAQAIQVIQRQIAVLKGLADDLMDLARRTTTASSWRWSPCTCSSCCPMRCRTCSPMRSPRASRCWRCSRRGRSRCRPTAAG